jgi:hypothetical protein
VSYKNEKIEGIKEHQSSPPEIISRGSRASICLTTKLAEK